MTRQNPYRTLPVERHRDRDPAAAGRRAAALRLLGQDGVRLALLPDRRVRVEGGPPEAASLVREVRAELVELLSGSRCCVCGEPLAEQTLTPVGMGWAHRRCTGYPRKPARR
jgi:hypothetical protein